MKKSAVVVVLFWIAVGCSSPSDRTPVSVPTAVEVPTAPPSMTVSDWNDRAFALLRQQQWAEAGAAAQRALDLDRGSSAAWFNLGRAQLGAGHAGEALFSFGEASRLTGGRNADVEYYRGQAAVVAGKRVEAIRIYRQAIINLGADKEIMAALAPLQSGGAWVTVDTPQYRISYPDYWTVHAQSPSAFSAADGSDLTAAVRVEPFTGSVPRSHDDFLQAMKVNRNQTVGGAEHKVAGALAAHSLVRTIRRDAREFTASEMHVYLPGRRIIMSCEAWSPLFYSGALGSVCTIVEKSFQPKL